MSDLEKLKESLSDVFCEHCNVQLIDLWTDDEIMDVDYIPEHWYCSEFCYKEDGGDL